MDKCCNAVEALNIEHQESEKNVVTISIGGASVTPSSGKYTAEQFLVLVDEELYKAKESGRNRTSVIDLDIEG